MTVNSEKAFVFRQNNSGGYYHGPKWIIVPAESSQEALDKALKLDYFYLDGMASGEDCSCCGDRWSAWSSEYDSVREANSYCYEQDDDVNLYVVKT